jgi:hypothetical protein
MLLSTDLLGDNSDLQCGPHPLEVIHPPPIHADFHYEAYAHRLLRLDRFYINLRHLDVYQRVAQLRTSGQILEPKHRRALSQQEGPLVFQLRNPHLHRHHDHHIPDAGAEKPQPAEAAEDRRYGHLFSGWIVSTASTLFSYSDY